MKDSLTIKKLHCEMAFCAEKTNYERVSWCSKCLPACCKNSKPLGGDIMKQPNSKVSLYKRFGGILLFLQNKTEVFNFTLPWNSTMHIE